MKKILFATTAAAAMIAGGSAFAQGITLFGDARLGLGYNTSNDGDILDDEEVRAISRVRFGVRMTGETDTGITFGATIRADNAIAGEGSNVGGVDNQAAGNVFVSGAFGTLTYGDIASAHQQHAGDLPEIGLTGLGFFNELPYLGNRRHNEAFYNDNDGIADLIGTQSVRPVIRYDFDVAGFGVSLSSERDLNDIGIGASFSPNFGGGNFSIGGGWYDDDITSQWTVGANGGFGGYEVNVVYINTDDGGLETIGGGVGTTLGDIGINAFYNRVIGGALITQGDIEVLDPVTGDPIGFAPGVEIEDGDSAYGVGATFALGEGADLRGGVVRSYDGETAADLGIQLTF